MQYTIIEALLNGAIRKEIRLEVSCKGIERFGTPIISLTLLRWLAE
jgi:hypothetical protein